jgi:hypothetical protein
MTVLARTSSNLTEQKKGAQSLSQQLASAVHDLQMSNGIAWLAAKNLRVK